MDSRKGKSGGAAAISHQAERPTQKTIAALTGLAITTVSKALAGDPKIAPKTRDRVVKVADEIGYVPDRAAQRLRTGRTNVIALVLDPHSEIIGFSDSIISGVADALLQTPYHLVLMQHGLNEKPMDPIRRIVRNRLADGVILARTTAQDERVAFLLDRGFPFVTHGRTELGPHLWVDYDNEAFAAIAVERLARRGRRRLAMIAPSPEFMFGQHMRRGFAKALRAEGAEGVITDTFNLHSNPLDIRQGAFQMMTGAAPPDGWVCPGEIAAMAVSAAIYDAGLNLGEAADVVAKKTSPAIDLLRPGVSVISENLAKAGVHLANSLTGKIDGLQPPNPGTLLQPIE